ncbi:MAG: glycosyltransferase family 4 protein [Crocinitomicaceae bacterium]|nr:glycosyltransferase family 4 protein [Crocinitomicaceae bacterium]
MKKILFLTLHRPDRSPSQRFRFEQYLSILKENGYDYHFSYLLNAKDDKLFYSKGKIIQKSLIVLKSFLKRFFELKTIKHYDVVYIQRECFMLGTSFFERKIAKSGVKLIFDFDDSIWLQNVSDANRKFVWLKDANKTAKITEVASLVVVGNHYLEAYAQKYNTNVTIIPTTIDTDEYTRIVQPENGKICIGWSGSITTIQHFEFSLPFLKKIKEKYGDLIEIKVIGDANYKNEELGVKGLAWKKESEIQELSTFDIGIMPLPDDEWAKGKCGLKGLQYMALEIPTIMSPVGVNTEIIQDGTNGYLASTENEWIEKIELLINSKELRETIGKNGRKTVVDSYSISANAAKYLEAFKTA